MYSVFSVSVPVTVSVYSVFSVSVPVSVSLCSLELFCFYLVTSIRSSVSGHRRKISAPLPVNSEGLCRFLLCTRQDFQNFFRIMEFLHIPQKKMP